MSGTLTLFPARVAIGRADSAGNVYMTPDFSRALADLLSRVGGPTGMGTAELAVDAAALAPPFALVAGLQRCVAELQHQVATLSGQLAALNETTKRMADLEAQAVQVVPPTDWEHPGKIGAATPNSARFTTVNRLTFTQPTTGATFTLADGKTLRVDNTLQLTSNDGALLAIGGGGTLGSAAYRNGGSAGEDWAARQLTVASWFGCNGKGAQPSYALPVAATDAATTQALANAVRAALIGCGIGV